MHFNQVTTTLPNGLMVQHLSDGNIVQMTSDQVLSTTAQPEDEKDRVFLFASNGVVIRHLRNRDAEVLFPTGVLAHFSKATMTWTLTNSKGLRRAKRGGVEWDIEPLPCAYETDSVTGCRTMIREDKVLTIEYPDGSLFCQHRDGTLMRTSPDGSSIRIEKDGYAPVIFKRGTEKEDGTVIYTDRRLVAGGSRLGAEERSYDRVIVETHLPDGTVVDTYLDCSLSGQEEDVGIQHIFRRPDFSVLAVNQLDKVKIISSNARSSLNEASQKNTIGQDIDYLVAINQDFNDLAKGVYTAFVSNQQYATQIFTTDADKNLRYFLTSELMLNKQPLNPDLVNEDDDMPHGGILSTGTQDIFENINQAKNPFQKHFIFPRLFVIRNDGSGYELLSKEQLDYYFRV